MSVKAQMTQQLAELTGGHLTGPLVEAALGLAEEVDQLREAGRMLAGEVGRLQGRVGELEEAVFAPPPAVLPHSIIPPSQGGS